MTCVCCARDWLASRVRRSRAMGVGGVGVGVGVVTDEWRVLRACVGCGARRRAFAVGARGWKRATRRERRRVGWRENPGGEDAWTTM